MKLDLIGEVVEGGLRAGDGGFRLRHLRFVVGRIDLHKQIAGFHALVVAHGDGLHLACDAAAQLRHLGANVGVICRLDFAPLIH